ncbi:alpha/beta fold hydrolase [Ancylomarina sp. 16SWW S1-10-2]|uniref:alpha/beta fold hydrolase n=1 Tax=Ancylomarina sp. 16SWW S1-10-2 TaxID=2499681 RepID=UPI0012ADF625|nr:alpha/beta hydrolase [Ancylomarina sp. 16SWW S1-10-2]MRT91595.1 alpha/beta hydrolase [Ancylomarina sp. 16SWW S1-10-2]
MIHYLDTRISNLRYFDQGEGEVLVLLHGYLEAIETFDAFAKDLATKVRVICVDLPGHGQSTLKLKHVNVEDMAEAVCALVVELNLGKVHLMGHSMGGYVALAFADKYADKLASFSLLHSSANPDTEEKKENRKREIDLLSRGKKDLICNTAIPNTFSKRNQESFLGEIDVLIEIASNTKEEGIINALNAMMNRPDRNKILKALQIPKHSFVGREDNFIPFEKGMEWAYDNGMKPVIFENSGHMSFIEEKDACINAVIEIMK